MPNNEGLKENSGLTEYDFDVQQALIEKHQKEIEQQQFIIACLLKVAGGEVMIDGRTLCTMPSKSTIDKFEHLPTRGIILRLKEKSYAKP